jgi:hypothetical protein
MKTVQTVRAIATQLRPGILDDLGLAAAIEWQVKDFQKRSGILCALTLPGDDPPLGRDQATAIFRIFQEILTNVARHAQAAKVWVYLGEEQDAIVLEAEDNGVGISPTQLAERRSLGLLGMRERAGAFGGAVEIVGSKGQGTTVTVQIPVFLQTGQVAIEEAPSEAQFSRINRQIVEWGSQIDVKQLRAAYFSSKVLSRSQYAGVVRLLEIFGKHLSLVANQIAFVRPKPSRLWSAGPGPTSLDITRIRSVLRKSRKRCTSVCFISVRCLRKLPV